MFIYIAHAEADKADAEELQAFLKTRSASPAQIEDGSRGFHFLQPSDVVIALWSQKSVFGAHRMQFERRMLDAWADGRLVLVKLDHAILPVGLRDLPAIDASFSSGRDLAVWPQVERRAKEIINQLLVERSSAQLQREALEEEKERGGPPPPAGQAKPAARARVEAKSAAKGKRGPLSVLLVVLAWVVGVLLAALAGLYAFVSITGIGMLRKPKGAGFPEAPDSAWPLLIGMGLAAVVAVLVINAILVRVVPGARRPKRAEKKAAPGVAAGEEVMAGAPAPAPQPVGGAPATLFISYSHADNAAVEPVVKAVQANGRVVWIDKTGIQSGDGWAGEIVRAIKSAKGIMVMCSKHAFESDHVKREVYLADRYKKPMSPVFLEEAQPPEDFEYFFASVQWLELWKLPEADRPAAIGKALEAV